MRWNWRHWYLSTRFGSTRTARNRWSRGEREVKLLISNGITLKIRPWYYYFFKKLLFSWNSKEDQYRSICLRHGSAIRIRIHPKMSWIRNTVFKNSSQWRTVRKNQWDDTVTKVPWKQSSHQNPDCVRQKCRISNMDRIRKCKCSMIW
jgi:hypothetical protein